MNVKKSSHCETIERYCHVIGRNTTVAKTVGDGNTNYECMNKKLCEKNGGCCNERYSSRSDSVSESSMQHLG